MSATDKSLPPELQAFAARMKKRDEAEAMLLVEMIDDATEHGDSLHNAALRIVDSVPKARRESALRAMGGITDRYQRKVQNEAWTAAFYPKRAEEKSE